LSTLPPSLSCFFWRAKSIRWDNLDLNWIANDVKLSFSVFRCLSFLVSHFFYYNFRNWLIYAMWSM
jgi:hypothetical protein